jgi:hypothetical protein
MHQPDGSPLPGVDLIRRFAFAPIPDIEPTARGNAPKADNAFELLTTNEIDCGISGERQMTRIISLLPLGKALHKNRFCSTLGV